MRDSWIIVIAFLMILQVVWGLRMEQPAARLTYLEEKYGVSFMLYYIHLESNSKHNESSYLRSLAQECKILAQDQKRFITVGDLSSFEAIPECAPTVSSSVWQRSFIELPHADIATHMDINCPLKFGRQLPAGQFRNLSRVWLSKLPLLCEVAETQPDQVTVLLDAGIYSNIENGNGPALKGWKFALGALSSQDFETEAVHMSHYPRQFSKGRHTWFGSKKCSHDNPQACAMFMAVRGRHCPKVMKAYSDALLRVGATKCKCFDEEVVLTDMWRRTAVIQTVRLDRSPRRRSENDTALQYYEDARPTVLSDMLHDRVY